MAKIMQAIFSKAFSWTESFVSINISLKLDSTGLIDNKFIFDSGNGSMPFGND